MLTFLAVNSARAFCLQCLSDSLEARQSDVRAVVKAALMAKVTIGIRRGHCDRCRLVAPVVTFKG